MGKQANNEDDNSDSQVNSNQSGWTYPPPSTSSRNVNRLEHDSQLAPRTRQQKPSHWGRRTSLPTRRRRRRRETRSVPTTEAPRAPPLLLEVLHLPRILG